MPHSGGFARASLRWTRPRLTRRPRAAQHPAPQRGERVMTWSVKDDVECGRLHSTSSLALHVAKRPSAPAENRPIAVLSHSTLGGSVVRCQIRTPRWATQAWRCKIRTPRWATQAWRRQTAATAAHRPAHRRHTNPPDCSVRGMYVDAMEHYGNRRPRVERLVSAWAQGPGSSGEPDSEPDDPLIGAAAEPRGRPRTRLTDEEVDAMRTARANGVSVAALAKQFGVHRGTVWTTTRIKSP